MQQLLAVGLGGCIGAVARYTVTGLLYRRFPGFYPAGTLLVNVAGCWVIGLLMGLVSDRIMISPTMRLFLVTGFLGSLTTFSSFGYETVELLAQNQMRPALAHLMGNVVLGFTAVWLGRLMAGALGL